MNLRAILIAVCMLPMAASAQVDQDQPMFVGAESGNGGIPLEFIFDRLRDRAAKMLENLRLTEFRFVSEDDEGAVQSEVDAFLQNHADAMATDIQQRVHEWIRIKEEERQTCAWTLPSTEGPLVLSPHRCIEEGLVFSGGVDAAEKEEIAQALIETLVSESSEIDRMLDRELELVVKLHHHEAVHRVGGDAGHDKARDETFANDVADRLWELWHPFASEDVGLELPAEGLQPGMYQSGNSYWVEYERGILVERLQLSGWPSNDDLIVLSGSVRSRYRGHDVYGRRVEMGRHLSELFLERRDGLPSNHYFFETELVTRTADGARCNYNYKIKLIAVDSGKFFVAEYVPRDVVVFNSDEGRVCRAKGYEWRPHLRPYLLQNPDELTTELRIRVPNERASIYLQGKLMTSLTGKSVYTIPIPGVEAGDVVPYLVRVRWVNSYGNVQDVERDVMLRGGGLVDVTFR